MNTDHGHPHRQTVIHSFAVIGFMALLALGVWGAVYSSRFVPNIVGNVGTAAVYIGSVFSPSEEPDLLVIDTASSTIISFGSTVASTTTPVATTTPAEPALASIEATTPVSGQKITSVITLGATTPVAPQGLADLAVIAGEVGYLPANSTDSFVANTTVPKKTYPAVRFEVKNVGTHWSGTWRFGASIPNRASTAYQSESQPSIGPGDSRIYTLGFDQSVAGEQQPLVITINNDGGVPESSAANNSVTFKINVL